MSFLRAVVTPRLVVRLLCRAGSVCHLSSGSVPSLYMCPLASVTVPSLYLRPLASVTVPSLSPRPLASVTVPSLNLGPVVYVTVPFSAVGDAIRRSPVYCRVMSSSWSRRRSVLIRPAASTSVVILGGLTGSCTDVFVLVRIVCWCQLEQLAESVLALARQMCRVIRHVSVVEGSVIKPKQGGVVGKVASHVVA